MATSLTPLPHERQGGSMGGCEKEFWIYLKTKQKRFLTDQAWLPACGLAAGQLELQRGRDEPPGGPFVGVVCSVRHAKFEVLIRHVHPGIH